MADQRPNSLVHSAEASSLPRQARARVGQTTDPIPHGMHLDAEPVLHGNLTPAGHDVDRTNPKRAEELGLDPREAEKLHRYGREHVDLKNSLHSGMDWKGVSSSGNKNMPSTHRRPAVQE